MDLGTLDDLDSDALEVDDSPETNPEPTKKVDAKRFNALMAKHQKALDELRQLKATQAPSSSKEEGNVTDTPPEFLQQFQAMAERVAAMELKEARAAAVEKYPEAKPLAHMLVGATAEEVEDAAKQVAESLKAGASPKEVAEDLKTEATEPETTPAATASVSGGAVEGPTEPDIDSELAEARARKDWTAILRLKYKQAGVEV